MKETDKKTTSININSNNTNDEPIYNFRRLMSLIECKSRSLYAEALKPLGITYAELPFFLTLSQKNDLYQDELAELVGVDKALATRTLRSLEEKGLVKRTTDKLDSRKRCVSLTEKGSQHVDEVIEVTRILNKKMSAGISTSSMKTTYETLLQITNNLGASAGKEFIWFDQTIFVSKSK